jgi:hypothetical protein
MSSKTDKWKRREYFTKAVLIIVFLSLLVSFIGYMTFYGPGLKAFQLSWMELLLLGLSTYRLGHLISYDRVMEPFRRFFTETIPDPTGAGETVEAKGKGVQQAIGQLICCPICSGTWIAAALVYALYLWPDAARVFLTMTAAVGAAELLNAAGESWSWSAQYHRTLTGGQMTARKKNIVRIDQQPCDDELPERDEVRNINERSSERIRKP